MSKEKALKAPHHSLSQMRLHRWTALRHECEELSHCHRGSANEKRHRDRAAELMDSLLCIERYFAFPGISRMDKLRESLELAEHVSLSNKVAEISRHLVSDVYGSEYNFLLDHDEHQNNEVLPEPISGPRKNYFETLFVEDMGARDELALRRKLKDITDPNEVFAYDITVQRSFQDALIAILFNHNIQAVIIRYAPAYKSSNIHPVIKPYIQRVLDLGFEGRKETSLGPLLGTYIKRFRPEVDVYYITDTALSNLKESTLKTFRRVYYRKEDFQELHLALLRGIRERYETPFFSALKDYSQKPTGIFHAMPISRGNSVFKSRWMRDFGEFYGRNMFLAETSATTGGLDSLLQPTGPLKKAQEMAAKAYGALRTFFVTNGTSTANKIVLQGLVKPGDVVLVDRDCHKSHHYGLVLSGAYPVYLDSYPLEKYSMYGAVPLQQITDKLLGLKEAGRLDSVKMLLLTNCTFDGFVYNVERVMETVLAIKPDIIFLWDEAWFAFAGFTFNYRQRTGMYNAEQLHRKYKSAEYRRKYDAHIEGLEPGERSTLPDPDKVRIRVYATQSTHKTLSSFRQGSMIHLWDEDFRKKSEETFLESYMTHTSTSPNYQMLASLDAGRRQVQFEGYEMVEKAIELAMTLRAKIASTPLLRKYFRVLTVKDFIPEVYRQSGLTEYYDRDHGWTNMDAAWQSDEFVMDPTKITLFVGKTGVDGDTFKNKYLMDQCNIQINKTSRNTVLFMTNIGTTRGSITYLTNALLSIAEEFDAQFAALNSREVEITNLKIRSLIEDVPPLPDFSHFHTSFRAVEGVPGGDIREAYFLAYDENNSTYTSLQDCQIIIDGQGEVVSSSFVIPYPPGFPVLVPGQVVSQEILQFMIALDVTEIHGYRAELGLRVFTDDVLNRNQ